MSSSWTPEDTIVLVYFSSRGVLTRVVVKLIALKGGSLRNTPQSLSARVRRLCAEEQVAGRPAMYNEKTKTWDPQVADQWLVGQIVLCAKAKARLKLADEEQAPLYYDELKALTSFGPKEKVLVGDVSLERIQIICSPCIDGSPQIQNLDPIMEKLAWTVELPTSPITETETNQGSSTSSSNNESHSTPTNEPKEESPRASAGKQKVGLSEQ